ncbi:hypothetical protein KQX54_019229 [Cotesia glomerata]|uniref:Uncharacterized protein n=1 Tax=Cotesia glomerata TaxID=32391 RepID=A0AAV7J070_COTGL|nr:hypothetical protein KQX54_019229 [Cotesia glomerata]
MAEINISPTVPAQVQLRSTKLRSVEKGDSTSGGLYGFNINPHNYSPTSWPFSPSTSPPSFPSFEAELRFYTAVSVYRFRGTAIKIFISDSEDGNTRVLVVVNDWRVWCRGKIEYSAAKTVEAATDRETFEPLG